MINKIKDHYGHCDNNNCHIPFVSSFFINDFENGKCEVTACNCNANSTCFIENKNKSQIDFVAIDECLIASNDLKKCDCVVTNDSSIWFIELKEVDWSTRSSLNRQKKKNARRKAVKQIASTINDFKSKGIDLNNHLVVGLIAFPPFTNLKSPTSIPTTSSQSRILEFINLCGFDNLHEGNHIVL